MTLLPPKHPDQTVLDHVDRLHGRVVRSVRTGVASRWVERHAAHCSPAEREAASVVGELYSALLLEPVADPLAFVHRLLASSFARAAIAEPTAVLRRLAAFDLGAGQLLHRGVPEPELFVALMTAVLRALDAPVPSAAELRATLGAEPPGRRLEHLAATIGPPAMPADELDRRLLAAVRTASPTVVAIASHVLDAGGKRVRARLVLALAADDTPWVWQAATTVEWLHQVSLVLDDIVDAASSRRGRPCLHRTIGPVAAIATCDAILRAVSQGLPADLRRRAAVAAVDLARGELLESVSPATDVDGYLHIVRAKTGSLFRLAGWAGCTAAGLDPHAGATFGEALGVAFQVIDDALDLAADPQTTGKDACRDIATDRFTLPRAVLEQRLSDSERSIPPAGRSATWYARCMRSTGTLEACRAYAREQVEPTVPDGASVHVHRMVHDLLGRSR